MGSSVGEPGLELDPPRLLILMEMLEEFPAFRHRLIDWIKLRYAEEL